MTDVTFATLGVAEPILRALAAENYTTPTPIQARFAPVPQDQAREMLLAPMRAQGPLAGTAPEAVR